MLKRMITVLLTLMLTVMLLPKAALAADLVSPNPDGTTIDIAFGDTLNENGGTVTENLGTVVTNGSTGIVKKNHGTVENNNGKVEGNNNTVTNNQGKVEVNYSSGKITTNKASGVIDANNHNAVVTYNYGKVYNKGRPLNPDTNQNGGIVTNNFGTVYNDHGFVEKNGNADGTSPGVVFNDHGRVDSNLAGSTVHNYGGTVFFLNTGVVHNYGSDGGVIVGGTTYQYWRVMVSGTSADHVEISGVTDTLFDATWAREDIGVTLTPKDNYYFSSRPTAEGCVVTPENEGYKITGINRDTGIQINDVFPVTTVDFNSVTANGSDTETTTQLTLTFSQDIDSLTADDLTVTDATKGTLATETGTGVYTLGISDITVADKGMVKVTASKHSFAFVPADKEVAVRKFVPPDVTLTPTGSTRFLQAVAPSDAVFTVKTNNVAFPLSADNFSSATLDGAPLDLGTPNGAAGADGSVKSGSVIVTLHQTTLNALLPGNHTLVITLKGDAYAGRTVTSVITVAAPETGGGVGADVPRTGDSTPLWLLLGIVILAGSVLIVRRKRR